MNQPLINAFITAERSCFPLPFLLYNILPYDLIICFPPNLRYGSVVPVPGYGEVDVLIAGTSCKDCSTLNNHRQHLLMKNSKGGGGESYRTFKGMLEYVKRARPAMVVLENVCQAPWDDMCYTFEQIGYDATWRKCDSKYFYIPHTRQRGYIVAFNRRSPKFELGGPCHPDTEAKEEAEDEEAAADAADAAMQLDEKYDVLSSCPGKEDNTSSWNRLMGGVDGYVTLTSKKLSSCRVV